MSRSAQGAEGKMDQHVNVNRLPITFAHEPYCVILYMKDIELPDK